MLLSKVKHSLCQTLLPSRALASTRTLEHIASAHTTVCDLSMPQVEIEGEGAGRSDVLPLTQQCQGLPRTSSCLVHNVCGF